MRAFRSLGIVSMVALLGALAANAAVRYVNGSATGANTGASWTNAYTSLRAALAAAQSGDEIWVAAGTYKPDIGPGIQPGDRSASFPLVSGVAVYGGFVGNETARTQRDFVANPTILSGDLAGNDIAAPEPFTSAPTSWAENSYHILTGDLATGWTLDGLTITHANASVASNSDGRGGGMLATGVSGTIRNCVFTENAAASSGGGFELQRHASPIVISNVDFDSCTIDRNHATASGGGMRWSDGHSVLTNCTFRHNHSSDGASVVDGDGLKRFVGCTFENNRAVTNGGALKLDGNCIVIASLFQSNQVTNGSGKGGAVSCRERDHTLLNCTFVGNSVSSAGGSGGAVRTSAGSSNRVGTFLAVNCTFVGNTAAYGGAVLVDATRADASASLVNCTLASNTATIAAGGINVGFSAAFPPNATIANSILWNNSDAGGVTASAQLTATSGTPTVSYTDIQGGLSGTGNINIDPAFYRNPSPGLDGLWDGVNDDYGDLRLRRFSPAVDAGSSSALPADTADLDGDTNVAEPIPFDLGNGPRRATDACTPDSGAGGAPFPDLGALERGGSYAAPPAQAIIFVKSDAVGFATGASWADAYPDLNDALCGAANSGGVVREIWIAAGTYRPSTVGDRGETFTLQNGVAIYGGFGGGEVSIAQRDTQANPTILSGDLLANDDDNDFPDSSAYAANSHRDNSYHIVTATGADATAILDGLTIRGGNGYGAPDERGGGLYMNPGSPLIMNCTFEENSAAGGGGAGGAAAMASSSSPKFKRCTFTNNWAVNVGGDGGAISAVSTGTPVVRECVFERNHAVDGGGALYLAGGVSQTVLCKFNYNVADRGGAVISSGANTIAEIAASTFLGNIAPQHGGALSNVGAVLNVVNSAFVGNTSAGAVGAGGAVFNNVALATPNIIANCTFAANVARQGAAIFNNDNSGAISPRRTQIANSIFWLNANLTGVTSGEQVRQNSGAMQTPPSVDFCIVQDGWSGPGANNSAADPLFTRNPAPGQDQVWDGGSTDDPGNLQLRTDSPAIDAASNALVPPDVVDIDCDGNTLEPAPCDAAAARRFYQVGNSLTPAADLGAFESGVVSGERVYVSAAAPPGGDGQRWSTAYNDLASAASSANVAGCTALEIWVAAGVYHPGPPLSQGGSREMTFRLRDGMTLYGGFIGIDSETQLAQRDPLANETILSGDLNGNDPAATDNVFHVVTGTGSTAAAVLDGFTITGGAADTPRTGGGVVVLAGGPTLRNCRITANAGGCAPDIALSGAQITLANVSIDAIGGGAAFTHSVIDLQGPLTASAGEFDVHGATLTGPGLLQLDSAATLYVRRAPPCQAEVATQLSLNLPAGAVIFRPAGGSPPAPLRWELCDGGCSDSPPTVHVADATVVGASGRTWTIAPSGISAPATVSWTGSYLAQDISAAGRANGRFRDGGQFVISGAVYEDGLQLFDGALLSASVSAFQLQELAPVPPNAPNTLGVVGALTLRPTGGFLVDNHLGLLVGGAQTLTLQVGAAQTLTDFGAAVTLSAADVTPLTLTPTSGAQSETIVQSRISGIGQIQIEPGAKLILAAGARLNLTDEPDEDCITLLEPGAPPVPGGQVTVLGSLIVQDQASVVNSRVDVKLLDLQGANEIIHNDIRLKSDDITGFGGEFYAADSATVSCNVIRSEGDRYLDLDPDPADGQSPTIANNKIYVTIKQGTQSDQGELLELRTQDADNAVGGGASGAFALASSAGYSDSFALEELEILPAAKVNLTNRQGFVFQPANITTPEALYVRRIKLWPGAVLNTGLQRAYYQSLVDQNGVVMTRNPLQPTALLANGSQIVDVPVLGFSLKVIAMEDAAEFAVRLKTRLRDPADVQPLQPPFKQGAITRGVVPGFPLEAGSAMQMRTRDSAGGALTAKSVAAHGAFARAAEEKIVVAFRYLFQPPTLLSGGGAGQIVVYLSDSPEPRDAARLSEPGYAAHFVEIARVRPPTDASRPGGVSSAEFATFYGVFPRGALNFTRGTYVELELRGDDANCWIDDFDPQIYCSSNCGDLNGEQGSVDNSDFLLLVNETGRALDPFNHSENGPCLDVAISGDKFVDLSDVLAFDAFVNGAPLNVCDSGNGFIAGACPSSPTPVTGLATDSLLIAGKPNGANLEDRLFNASFSGACLGAARVPASTPDPLYCHRSNGRVVADPTGALYQIHAIQGLVRLDNAQVVLTPGIAYSTPIAGASVRVGVSAGGFLSLGIPLVDVAFHPSDNTIVYVAPVIVDEADVVGSGVGVPYHAAAKLRLLPGGAFDVLAIYGANPAAESNVISTIASGEVIYSPDHTRIREIEVDTLGNVFVLAAQAIDNSDYLLTYDEAAAHPAPRVIPLSTALSGAGVAGSAPRGAAQMLVSRVVPNRIYFAQSATSLYPDLADANGERLRVLRCNILRGGGASANAATGIALASAVDVTTSSAAHAAPDPDVGLGFRSLATALVEHPTDGRVFLLGMAIVRTPSNWGNGDAQYASMFNQNAPLSTRPFFAALTSSQTGAAVASSLSCNSIGLPMGAAYVSAPPQACCVAGNVCLSLPPALCAAQGGTSRGAGSVCASNPCAAVYPIGDMNCDHLFNNFDIDPFVLAIVDAPTWQAQYPGCPILNGDMNHDQLFNNFDIDPFVNCLVNGGCN